MKWSELVSRLGQSETISQNHAEFLARPKAQQDDLKDRGAFLAGVSRDGRRRKGSILSRSCITLDLDSLPDAAAMVTALDQLEKWGVAYAVYSTAKHCPAKPRLRVVIPLREDVEAELFPLVTVLVARMIQPELTWFDPTCDEPGRIMYWPVHCQDVEPVFRSADKPFYDAAGTLPWCGYDWKDVSTWPTFPGTEKRVRDSQKRQQDPVTKSGIVGAFCRAYDVPAAMAAFLPGTYEEAGEGRYTFTGGSTTGGAVTYDDGKFLFSHHATDPCSGQLVNAWDLVRLHKFGELDEEDPKAQGGGRPSYKAMVSLARQNQEVMTQMARERWEQAGRAFQPLYSKEPGSDVVAWGHRASDWIREVAPDKNGRYGLNDLGAGRLFADAVEGVARFVPERRQWFVYQGGVWQADAGGLRTAELCKHFADVLVIYALGLPDGKFKDDYLKHAFKWQTRNYRRTVIEDASSVHPIYAGDFDHDPWLFNCANGTLDLRTGELRKHDPGDLLTLISSVEYDPGARSELWEQVIRDVMQGDEETIVFLQKALGYGLTGDTSEECFFTMYGATTRNGKGTVAETYMRVLGGYGRTAKPDTLALKQKPNGSGPSEDIARLAGARAVNLPEPGKGMVLSSALVKTLTGNDKITARFLHENSFEFYPQFKFFINTNYLPVVNDPTLFSSGRVKVIPFTRHFTEEEQDKGLKRKLAGKKNQSGILNWCLEGLQMWQQQGLDPPKAVREATEAYRIDSDKIARFVSERMEPDALGEIPTEEAYAQYRLWCGSNGCYPENQTNFKQAMEGYAEIRRKRPHGAGSKSNPRMLILGLRWAPVPCRAG